MDTEEELADEEEYEDMLYDIREKCFSSGCIRFIETPRSVPGEKVAGVGQIFVKYYNIPDSQKSSHMLKKFILIVTSHFDPDKYHRR